MNQGFSQTCAAVLLTGVLACASAFAADPKEAKDGKEQLRSLQQRLRAQEQEKTKLVQGKAEIEGQLKDAGDKLAKSQRSAGVLTRKRAELDKAIETMAADKVAQADLLAAAEKKLADTAALLADTQSALSKTQSQLVRSEAGSRQLTQTLSQREQSLAEAQSKNESLYRLGASLIAQIEEKGLGTVFEKDPVTRLARVSLENKVELYREQLDTQRLAEQQSRQDQARSQAIAQRAEKARADAEQAVAIKAERDQVQRVKAKQQSELDKFTRNLLNFFDGFEW